MATTTILSSVTAGGSYPTDVSISASNGCGSLCFIPTADITEQMTYELPAISVDVIMPDDSIYTNIQVLLDNIQGDEPYIIPLYELPSSCSLRVMPLFDKYALKSHNENIECGFDGTIWDTPTAIFPISVVFDDTDISSEGGSGGGGGGQSGATVLSGSSNPSSSLGSDGDMYLKTTNMVVESVTFAKPQRVQFDYYMNKDSVVELDCILPAPTDSYDTPWGSRGNTDHFIAYNGGTLRYVYDGDSGNIGNISSYYNKRMLITVSRTNIKVECEGSTIYDTAINGGTTTSDVKLGLFALFTSDSGSTAVGTSASGTLYRCRISENGVVVRDYIPHKDAFGNYCLYDTTSGVVYPPLGGSITGTEVQGNAVVDSGFVKVNSEWQPLIGTELADINIHGGGGGGGSDVPQAFTEGTYIKLDSTASNIVVSMSGELDYIVKMSFDNPAAKQILGYNLAANAYFGINISGEIAAEWSVDDTNTHGISDIDPTAANTITVKFRTNERIELTVEGSSEISLGYPSGFPNYSSYTGFTVGSSAVPASIYSAVFKDTSGNIISDLRPCKRNKDNVVGLYDVYNGIFYPSTNAELH